MKPTVVRLSAAGSSAWIPLNYRIETGNFGVALAVKLSSGASLTYSVQHTFDDIETAVTDWSAARSTTTGTITRTNHGLSANDWVLFSSGPAPFDYASGKYSVTSVTNANVFVITVADSGAAATGGGKMHTARVFNHDVLASQTASMDGNYAYPPSACRLTISSYSSGFAELTVIQAGR